MPTEECWRELGELRAEVRSQMQQFNLDTARIQSLENRIKELESDRLRIKTVGGVITFLLVGIGMFFADPIRKLILSVIHFP